MKRDALLIRSIQLDRVSQYIAYEFSARLQRFLSVAFPWSELLSVMSTRSFRTMSVQLCVFAVQMHDPMQGHVFVHAATKPQGYIGGAVKG